MQLDAGAQAFATLDAGAVSTATPAAVLQPGNVTDPSLLASTPDANTTDPFIQEEAAKLNYDPQQIFNFLHTEIGYNSYLGSLRGARGTLWSSAGNALDVASLGVALMRASGIPAQYVSGTLSQSQAQQLILSMFPASVSDGRLHPGRHADRRPGERPATAGRDRIALLVPVRHRQRHAGRRPAHGRGRDRGVGQTFTTSTGTFTEVPADLRANDRGLAHRGDLQPSRSDFRVGVGLSGYGRSRSDVQRCRSGGPAADDREFRQQYQRRRFVLRDHDEYLYALHRHGRRCSSRLSIARCNSRDSRIRKC